jgi:TolA-binding protein
MDILKLLFEPIVFFSILGGSFLLAMAALLAVARQDQKISKLKEAVKKETTRKEELHNQVSGLKEEVGKLSGELGIKSKMYEGLVGQYNELERDSERLAQELESSKKSAPKPQPQGPVQPQKENQPAPNPPLKNTP